jgi:hypothetical protein
MAFARYRSALLSARDVHDPALLIAEEGPLAVRYAPFDHVNPAAKVVILGITPGEVQANEALRTARAALQRGLPDAEAMSLAKADASFAGPMRANLVAMLDHIGVAGALGIASTASLWSVDLRLVQFASALRHPVFKSGKNYTGSNPGMTTSPLLRQQLLEHTGAELASLPDALVVPLGPAVTEACRWLAAQGCVSSDRLIEGMPHPSGANGERIAYFLGRKERAALSTQTDPTKIDAGRESAVRTVAAWTDRAAAA